MAALVGRLRAFVAERPAIATEPAGGLDVDDLVRRTGLVLRGRGKAEVILASQTAAELGDPGTASCATVLLTATARVTHGRVTRIGPDLDRSGRLPFGQVVVLRADPPLDALDPFDVESAQYLTNRLPGYMVRSVPGRLWARVRRGSGLRLLDLGQALAATYAARFEAVRAVEVVLVTASAADVDALGPIAAEAAVYAGHHRKLVLTGDGQAECLDLDCISCDEKPVCDALRDIEVKRRRGRSAAGPGPEGAR